MTKSKKILAALLCAAMMLSMSACSNDANSEITTTEASDTTTTAEEEETTTKPRPERTTEDESTAEPVPNPNNPEGVISPSAVTEDGIEYEAESAALYGNMAIIDVTDFSNKQGVEKFESASDFIEFYIELEEAGVYDITFIARGIGSDKENFVSVDGEQIGSITHLNNQLSEASVLSVVMSAGEHKITLTKSWGWIQLDKMIIKKAKGIDDEVYNVTSTQLINPNATAETKSLYKFLCDSYGEYIISGQVCDSGINGTEFKAIHKITDKYPAMLGLDMMDYTEGRIAEGASSTAIEKAITFYNDYNGIVTFCWHWNAPHEYLKSDTDSENGNPSWWGGFYSRNTNFDIAKVMNDQDEEGKKLLDKDIAAIAAQLKTLEEAGVPVIWRPLHEASGGWFWWGAKGADAYKKLWIYLYDQLTNVYECNNLIWVYNGQSAEWYPGDEYVDIIGEDIYPGEQVYSPQTAKFSEALDYSETNKIVALTENGCVFDIDAAIASNTKWAWFNTWGGDFVVKGFSYSEQYTEEEILKKAYDSEYVLTLDELPDLKTY